MRFGSKRSVWPTILVLAFVVSRGVVFALGVRSTDELPGVHIADRDLLSTDALRSLFFLHTQPPLFNAAVAVVLRVAKLHVALAASLVYWTIGLALALLMYRLFLLLGLTEAQGALATMLFTLSPACLLYETFNLYTYPVAMLLVATTYFAYQYAHSGAWRSAVLFSATIATIALVRSLYHLLWVAVAATILALVRRPSAKVAAVLALPVIAVAALYAKNDILFGFFGSSSFLGTSLFRISTELLPPPIRLHLAEQSVLSPFALYNVNHSIYDYPVAAEPVASIDFNSAVWRALLPYGWSKKPEGPRRARFVWSDGPWSVLILPSVKDGPLAMTLACEPFLGRTQTITTIVNGKEVGTFSVNAANGEYHVLLPAGVLRKTDNVVAFRYGYTVNPRDLGLSRDGRDLAVRWRRLAFDPPVIGSSIASDIAAQRAVLPGDVAGLERVFRVDGGPNLNHWLYPLMQRRYERDAIVTILRFPGVYLHAVGRACLIFWAPPMEHPAFRYKRRAIGVWDRFYSACFYGSATSSWPAEHSHMSRWVATSDLFGRVSWISLALAAVTLPAAVLRTVRRRREPGNAGLLFALWTILFVFVVSNAIEYGENNRFRMEVEPLLWVVEVTTIATWLGRKPHLNSGNQTPPGTNVNSADTVAVLPTASTSGQTDVLLDVTGYFQ